MDWRERTERREDQTDVNGSGSPKGWKQFNQSYIQYNTEVCVFVLQDMWRHSKQHGCHWNTWDEKSVCDLFICPLTNVFNSEHPRQNYNKKTSTHTEDSCLRSFPSIHSLPLGLRATPNPSGNHSYLEPWRDHMISSAPQQKPWVQLVCIFPTLCSTFNTHSHIAACISHTVRPRHACAHTQSYRYTSMLHTCTSGGSQLMGQDPKYGPKISFNRVLGEG